MISLQVATAMFLERARMIETWNTNVLVIKDGYSKEIAMGMREITIVPMLMQGGAS